MTGIADEKARIRADLASERSALLRMLLMMNGDTDRDGTTEQMLADLAAGDREAAVAIRTLCFPAGPSAVPAKPSPNTALHSLLSARRALLDAFAMAVNDPDRITPGLERRLDHVMRRRALADSEACQRLQMLGCGLSDAETGVLAVEAMRAARKELLTTIALIHEAARPGKVVASGETLRERLEKLEAEDRAVLAQLGVVGLPTPEAGGWKETWKRLHRTRQLLLRAVEARGSDIDIPVVAGRVDRDRELAAQLRVSKER